MEERVVCPSCGEEIAAFARKCRHCEELVVPAEPEPLGPAPGPTWLATLLWGSGLLVLLLGVMGVLGWASFPTLRRARQLRHERAVVESLHTIRRAQERLRSSSGSYGDLAALKEEGLIDALLSAGILHGYTFQVAASEVSRRERWIAVASPVQRGQPGSYYFATNHTGAIYYRVNSPIPLDLRGCRLPPDVLPWGE